MRQIWKYICIKFVYCFLLLINQQRALKYQPISTHKLRLQASFDNVLEISSEEQGPQFTRGNQMNYAALWQIKEEYYLSPDRLRELNRQLLKSGQPQGADQKKNLVDELSVTYFARHHNVIREEYQYEKAIVEDRLKTWSLKRLQQEGVVLLNLNADMEGSLYQDSVMRFHLRDFVTLPMHKFVTGDSVRISNTRIAQSSTSDEVFVEGIVIDKRTKFLDIAVRSSEAQSAFFTGGPVFRLDAFVNRVTYDRMIEALQSFLPGKTLSSTLRDLILYSYPNSMLRLSNAPGGLKLALPLMDEEENPIEMASSSSSFSVDRGNMVSAVATASASSPNTYASNDSNNNNNNNNNVMTLGSSLSKLIAQSSQAQRPRKSFQFVKSTVVAAEAGELAGSAASSINNSTINNTGFLQTRSQSTLPGIFRVNRKLQAMSENFPKISRNQAALFTVEEIRRAVADLSETRPLNPSQHAAVEAALLRPLSLCQGPPGTGNYLPIEYIRV